MLILKARNLKSPRLAQGFSPEGGVSEGISPAHCGPLSAHDWPKVIENRRRVAQTFGAGTRLLTLYQIHSPNTVTVTTPWR